MPSTNRYCFNKTGWKNVQLSLGQDQQHLYTELYICSAVQQQNVTTDNRNAFSAG